MTGAEFASKYTVLKPLDQRAVRSFVAQEQSTRRAVMVHWLDQLSVSDRSAMLARLDRLPGDARERVLTVENVDGTPVVVTRMILDFDSFGKWLDRVAPLTQASPPPAPASGGFTDIFLASTPKVSPPPPPPPPPAAPPRGAPVASIDSPTVSWTPPSIPKVPEPKPEVKKPEAKPGPSISVRFREPGSGPKPPAPPVAAPPPPPPPPPPAPKPVAPKAPAPGEFTRIFGATHVEPDPVPPSAAPLISGSSGAAPSATQALERQVAPPPRSSAPSPPLAPSPSSPWSGPPPVVPLPSSPSASGTPMPGANINLPPAAPVMPAQPVQSDFTRIIGAARSGPAMAAPVTPAAPVVAAPPAPAAPAPPSAPVAAASKAVMPMLIGLGALAISALVLVIYFLIKR